VADLDALRAQHGKLLTVAIDGQVAAFRPMTVDEARDLSARLALVPDLSFELAVGACRACLVSEPDAFEALLDLAPLAFDFDDGLCGRMLKLASEEAHATAKSAVKAWRGGERNLAQVATNLLAFKAYAGGAPSAAAFAGALSVAEGLDTMKGLFRLHLAFMKSLGKRK
jgi:hypothetical protein